MRVTLETRLQGFLLVQNPEQLFNKTQHKQLAACSGCPGLSSVRVSTSALSDLAVVPDKGPQDLVGKSEE